VIRNLSRSTRTVPPVGEYKGLNYLAAECIVLNIPGLRSSSGSTVRSNQMCLSGFKKITKIRSYKILNDPLDSWGSRETDRQTDRHGWKHNLLRRM